MMAMPEAIGREHGTVSLYLPNLKSDASNASTKVRLGTQRRSVSVSQVALDTASSRLSSDSSVRAFGLWIDVEGSSFEVLPGGRSAISKLAKVIILETEDEAVLEGSGQRLEINDLLINCGQVPIARDREHPYAFNILSVNEGVYSRNIRVI